ncbi:MAG TPA: prolyl oligopeptidase family serine peptidase [Chthoniobacterales bacterium]
MFSSFSEQDREWTDQFQASSWLAAPGVNLPYRMLRPVQAGEQFPLVLFLHGAGERGSDNRVQLRHGVRRFALAEMQARFPCFVVAPQCPRGPAGSPSYWLDEHPDAADAGLAGTEADLLAMVLTLTDAVMQNEPVDFGRVYVTGISMGGFATWTLPARRPDFFAAAVPVCGGGDPGTASLLQTIPIWAFHGSADQVVPVQYSRQMVEALRKQGTNPKYTEYEGVGHDSWTPAYKEPELLNWMFSQHRLLRGGSHGP